MTTTDTRTSARTSEPAACRPIPIQNDSEQPVFSNRSDKTPRTAIRPLMFQVGVVVAAVRARGTALVKLRRQPSIFAAATRTHLFVIVAVGIPVISTFFIGQSLGTLTPSSKDASSRLESQSADTSGAVRSTRDKDLAAVESWLHNQRKGRAGT